MKQTVLLAALVLLTGCMDSSSIEELEIFGSSRAELSTTYSDAERKSDFKEFKKNYNYYKEVIKSDRTFRNAPDFLFINKFSAQIDEIKEKYGYPYRIEGSDKLYQAGNMDKLNKLQKDISHRVANIRNDYYNNLPLSAAEGHHQRIIADELSESKNVSYHNLSQAFLESILQAAQTESSQNPEFLMRELDSLTGLIPRNFSPSYFKISLDNSLEEKWQKPSIINPQMDLDIFLKEGKSHPHLSALNFLLAFRRFKQENEYHSAHPLIVFDRGHILPAFAKYSKEGFEVQAILPYARGNGILNYGKTKKIKRSLMFLTADDFILAYIYKNQLSAEQLKKYLVKAQDKTTILYGLAKTDHWNNSASQKYFFHQLENIPLNRPLITEISVNSWYKWLGKQSKDRDLASTAEKLK